MIWIFAISLVVLAAMIGLRIREAKTGHLSPFRQLSKYDGGIHSLLSRVRQFVLWFNWENILALLHITHGVVKTKVGEVKRKYNHKQHKFFVRKNVANKDRHASFFLKDIKDYKETLREGRDEVDLSKFE